jgi:hypothetical protein
MRLIIRGVKFERNLAIVSAAMDACLSHLWSAARKRRGVVSRDVPPAVVRFELSLPKAMSDFSIKLKNVIDGTHAS